MEYKRGRGAGRVALEGDLRVQFLHEKLRLLLGEERERVLAGRADVKGVPHQRDVHHELRTETVRANVPT